MKTKRFSLITILAVIMLAFTTLFGISLKSDKASAATSTSRDYRVYTGKDLTVDSNNDEQVSVAGKPHTFEAMFYLNWTKNGVERYGAIIGGWGLGYSSYFNFEVNASKQPRLYWVNDGKITDWSSSGVVACGAWNHVVIVRDTGSSTMRCYINGVEMEGGTYSSQTTSGYEGIGNDTVSIASTSKHIIGRDSRETNYFCGKLNYTAVSTKVLTAAQVAEAYKNSKRVIESVDNNPILVKNYSQQADTYYRASAPITANPNTITATINIPTGTHPVHPELANNIGQIVSTFNGAGSVNNVELRVDENGHIAFTWDNDGQLWDRIDGCFDTAISNDVADKLDVRKGADVHITFVKRNDQANPFWLYINGVKVSEASYYFYDSGYMHYSSGATSVGSVNKLWPGQANKGTSVDTFISSQSVYSSLNDNAKALFKRVSNLFYNNTIDLVPNYGFGIGKNLYAGKQLPFPGTIKDVAMYSEIIDVAAEYAIGDKKTINKAPTTANSFTGRESVLANWVLDSNQQALKYDKNYAHDVKDYSGNGLDAFLCTIGDYFLPETDNWQQASNDEYTIIYIPDTQCTVRSQATYTDAIFDWIVANKSSMNLQFVMGLGDIIDGSPLPAVEPSGDGDTELNTEEQWDRMALNYKKLSDAGIYWSAPVGNHDYDLNRLQDLTQRKAGIFNTHFGYNTSTLNKTIRDSVLARYHTDKSGTSAEDDMLNVIYKYTATTKSGTQVNYLVVALEFGPSPETLAWASSVISQPEYANYRVIFNTHSLVFADGAFGDNTASNNPQNLTNGGVVDYWDNLANGEIAANGDYMWENFISRNPNMFLAASGHIETDTNMFRQDTGIYGNTVLSMLCDGQGTSYYSSIDGTSGWGDPLLLVAKVNEKTKTIKYYYYNPVNNMMFGVENQWEYDFSNALHRANYYNEAIKNVTLDSANNKVTFEIDSAYYTYAEPYITDVNGEEIPWGLANGKYSYTIPAANKMPLTIDVKAVTLATNVTLMEGDVLDLGKYLPSDFTFTIAEGDETVITRNGNILSFAGVGTATIKIFNTKGVINKLWYITTEKQVVGSFSRFNELVKDFKMDEVGARFRLMWTQFNCGITYIGSMPTELAQMVTPKLLFVSQKNIDNLKLYATGDPTAYPAYADLIEGGKYAVAGDYVAALEKAGYITDENRDKICLNAYTQTEDDTTYLIGGVKNITNVADANKKWFVIYYFEYLGQRYYAKLPYGSEANSSRSIAYVTSAFAAEKGGYDTLKETDANAAQWVNLFSTNAIHDALNKADSTAYADAYKPSLSYDSVLQTSEGNANAAIASGENVRRDHIAKVDLIDGSTKRMFKATYYDDLLTHTTKIFYYKDTGTKDENGNTIVQNYSCDVTGYLDFYFGITPTSDEAKKLIQVTNGAFIKTLGVGTTTTEGIKWNNGFTSGTAALTVSAFNLSADENKPYVELAVPDQGYDSGDTPTAFEPIAELTIKPDNNKRIFTKSFTDVKPEYDQNKSNNLTDGVGEGTVTVTGENYDFDEETQTPNVTGSVSANFVIKPDVYKLTIKYVHTSGIKLAEDSAIYLAKGTVYDGETQTIDSGYNQGETIKNAIESLKDEANNPLKTLLGADKWWVSGIVTGDEEIVITYSNAKVWNGTKANSFAGGIEYNKNNTEVNGVVHGTKENPYKIQTAEQLAYLAQVSNEGETYTDENKNGIYDAGDVLNDKNGNGKYDPGNLVKVGSYYEFGKGQYFELVGSIDLNGKAWTPICYSNGSWSWHFFAGNFNGNGFSINGLYINNANAFAVGLFGGIVGTVSNLTIKGSITAKHRAGGLAYYAADNAVIENVRSYVDVTVTTQADSTQTSYASGLIGTSIETTDTYPVNKTQVVNCENYGKITAPGKSVAGIVAHMYGAGSAIINCTNYGAITGGANVGGILGTFTQMVKGCANFGTITAYVNEIKPIVDGETIADTSIKASSETTVETNYNGTNYSSVTITQTKGKEIEYATVIDGYYVGGIIGDARSGATIEDTVNYGSVIGISYVGGLAGRGNSTTIENSNNHGTVNGSTTLKDIGLLCENPETTAKKFYKAGGITAQGENDLTAQKYADIMHNIISNTPVGNIVGLEMKHVDLKEDSNTQVNLKINFVDTKGTAIYDYKTLSAIKGTYIDRDTKIWIGENDPTRIMSKYSNVAYGAGSNYSYVNSGPIEGMIELVNYHINKQYGGNYLPNMFWWSGILEEDTVIDITFTEADVWDGTSASGFAGGSGTKDNPYLISTGEQLALLAQIVNGTAQNVTTNADKDDYYKLTNSIDLNGIEWTPIGQSLKAKYDTENHWSNNTAVFSGNFDGNGYTIAGLKTTNQGGNEKFVGLFGYVSNNNKEIKDLVIQGEVAGFHDVGGLAGAFHRGTAKNITTFVDVSSDVYFAWGEGYYTATTGGIAGGIDNGATILNCVNYGDVTTNGNNVGGIIGTLNYNTKQNNVLGCVNYGNVTARYHVGGIVGYSNIHNVVSGNTDYGDVTGNSINNAGGIIGTMVSGTSESNNTLVRNNGLENPIEIAIVTGDKEIGNREPRVQIENKDYHVLTINYYVDNELYSSKYLALEKGYYGRSASGVFTKSLALGNYYSSATDTKSPDIAGYLPDKLWVAGYITEDIVENVYYTKAVTWDGTVATSFAGGIGTETNPFLISNGAQLAYLSKLYQNKNACIAGNVYYKLTTSIDLGGKAWTPIGSNDTFNGQYAFQGNFDGNGYTISGLAVSGGNGLGLFANFAGTATNLSLQGSVTSTGNEVGGFAGILGRTDANGSHKYGYLDGVLSFVDVTSNVSGGYAHVGGVVGSSGASSVTNVYNYGNVKVTASSRVGGLFGGFYGDSKIQSAINYGHIIGSQSTDKTNVGGIVGAIIDLNDYTTEIINATNYGSIDSGAKMVGGIVGGIESGAKLTITNSLNTATITGYNAVGGIVGLSAGNLTYNEEGGKGFNTDTYASQGAVTGNAAVAGIVGQISGGTATIYNPRNCGDITATYNKAGGVVGQVSSSAILTIQNAYNLSTITGPSIVGGIVAYIESATVSLNNVTNAKDITSAGSQIGGIVGYNKSNTTSLSVTIGSNKNSITGATKVGGLIGDNEGTVVLDQVNVIGTSSITITGTTDSKADTTGDSNVGGMVGESSGALYIIGTSNSSVTCVGSTNASIKTLITAPGRNVGGVIGYASGTVMLADAITFKNGNNTVTDKTLINSTTTAAHAGGSWGLALNNTSVIGSQDVGGVIGDFNGTTLTLDDVRIINNSSVHAGTKNGDTISTYNSVAGGYIGRLSEGTVNIIDTTSEKYTLETSAIVSGKDSIGGFIGCADGNAGSINISSSNNPITNKGSVTATGGYAGGIIGHVSGSVTNGVNLTKVTNKAIVSGTTSKVGGIIGRINSGSATLTSVTNNASVTGTSEVGGIVGQVNGGTLNVNIGKNLNSIEGTNEVGGIVGRIEGTSTVNLGNEDNAEHIVSNQGAVTATGEYSGGIVGRIVGSGETVTISYATNTKKVEGTQYVGGIVGKIGSDKGQYTDASGTSNTSNIYNSTITINNTTNSGEVSGTKYAGGLIGLGKTKTTITSSNNTANVSSTDAYVGGLIGYIGGGAAFNITGVSGTATNSGNVTGTGNVGGLIGHILSGTVKLTTVTVVNNTAGLTISASGNNVGGMVGSNSGSLYIYGKGYDSYAAPTSVGDKEETYKTEIKSTSGSNVGGFVGNSSGTLIMADDIANDAPTGAYWGPQLNFVTVSGKDSVGGIIGQFNGTSLIVDSARVQHDSSVTASGTGVGGYIGTVSAGEATIENTTGSTNVMNQVAAVYGVNDVGGFIGSVSSATVIVSSTVATAPVRNDGTITATNNNAGGIIGYVAKGGTTNLTTVTNNGSVTGTQYVGGLVGYATGTLNITTGTNNATVKATTGGAAGGIVGVANALTSEIKSSSNNSAGVITATTNCAGGIVGQITGASNVTINACSNAGKVTATANYAGGLVGHEAQASTLTIKGGSTNSATITAGSKAGQSVGLSVWDGNYAYDTAITVGADGSNYFDGAGTSASPWLIHNAEDLAELSAITKGVNYGSGKYFKLMANIDLSVATFNPICWRGNYNDTSWKYFKGTFEGNQNKINLKADVSGTGNGIGYGLFQGLSGASVKNLIITGSINAVNRVGALTYILNGATTVDNVTNTATIDVSTTDTAYTGGIAGTMNSGTVEIKNSINEGAVTSAGARVGGILGNIDAGSVTITSCSNTKAITGASHVGGIMGCNNGATVITTTCSNTGNVTATTQNAGGILGYVTTAGTTQYLETNTNTGTIKAVSTTASAKIGTASPNAGKIVGKHMGTDVWDGTYTTATSYTFEGSGTSSSPYLINSAEELATLSKLSWAQSGGFGSGVYYKQMVNIDLSVGNWKGICDYNDSGWVGADVTTWGFDGAYNGNNKIITMKETAGKNWTGLFWAIKNGTVQNLTLEGTITAGSYSGALTARVCGTATISGITNNIDVTRSSSSGDPNNYIGMIGYIGTGLSGTITIQNCINNGDMDGDANIDDTDPKGNVIGGIVGGVPWQSSSTLVLNITNCTNTGKISGLGSVAGIIGSVSQYTTCNISGSKNQGDISGKDYVGGFIGSTNGTITIGDSACTNSGTIKGASVGGFVGRVESGTTTIKNSTNSGTINSLGRGGGIVGHANYGSTLKLTQNCHNTATASISSGNFGGLLGYFGDPTTANDYIGSGTLEIGTSGACSNTGEINKSNLNYFGGIVGQINNGITAVIKNCTNNASITGKNYIGGIVGYVRQSSTVTIENCINGSTANGIAINATEEAGGIIGTVSGSAEKITISSCTNNASIVVSSKKAGGITSYIKNSSGKHSIKSCTNNGTVKVGTTVANTQTGTADYYIGTFIGQCSGTNPIS